MSDIQGKVVMVTGGSKGIGARAARQFLLEGAKYVAILDVDEKAGMLLQNELTIEYGAKVKFIKCDVTKDDHLTESYKRVLEDNDCIDIVINNAGTANESEDMYKSLIAINYTALVTSTLKAMDFMHKGKSGRGGIIVNTSSIGALRLSPYFSIYCSTKSAILHFTSCIGSIENYYKTGVKVMTICYGVTDTDIMAPQNLKPYEMFDMGAEFDAYLKSFPRQRTESAATSLVEVCRRGESGTTWLSRNDLPVEDITSTVNEAYSLLSATVISQ